MLRNRRSLYVLGAAAVLYIAAFGAWRLGVFAGSARVELSGTTLDDPQPVESLSLVDENGDRVIEEALQGGWSLVFFGYVNCPDVCSPTLARLAQAYRDLGEPEDLRIVMITVDPDRDTPVALREFTDRFHEVIEGWTGSPEEIASAASRFFIASLAGPDGSISHTTMVALVDPGGRIRAYYGQDKLGAITEDLRGLVETAGAT